MVGSLTTAGQASRRRSSDDHAAFVVCSDVMTTDRAIAAAQRWALADERARAVLAATPITDRQRAVTPIAQLLGASAAVLAVLVVLGLTLPPDAQTRWVVSIAVAVGALVVLILDIIQRRRHAASLPPVVAVLQTRERHAVRQAFQGRRAVPDDRREVVDAAAVQAAGGSELRSLVVTAVLWGSIAASGATIWPVYAVLALVNTAAVVVPALDTLAARRWLAQHPNVGKG